MLPWEQGAQLEGRNRGKKKFQGISRPPADRAGSEPRAGWPTPSPEFFLHRSWLRGSHGKGPAWSGGGPPSPATAEVLMALWTVLPHSSGSSLWRLVVPDVVQLWIYGRRQGRPALSSARLEGIRAARGCERLSWRQRPCENLSSSPGTGFSCFWRVSFSTEAGVGGAKVWATRYAQHMISIDFLSRTPGDEVPDCSDPTGMGGRVWKGWGSKRLPEGEEGSQRVEGVRERKLERGKGR